MKQYEAMVILKPDLQSDALQIMVKEALDIIKKHKGTVENANELGKRQLSYNIKKNKEGFYYLAQFKAEPDAIKEIKRDFSLNGNVLRAIITVVGG